ncbi:MAG: FAD-binding oxidoreductase [Acidobacteriaceae bacterium]|nr:FAD-binding oxidoreductase [Acidobacteriaceae bacterium]
MQHFTPASAAELADVLREAAAKAQTIQVIGRNSKKLMGGPVVPAQTVVSTAGLRRVLRYERDDLTISVEAGTVFSELQAILAENGQMIALDPPFSADATVGGVLATNGSGPIRRGYGTARDLVIGMTFATLEGKLVKTGGMVVKNVAGLDMGKMMIGSFGTLAVMTSANFRVHSLPPETRTYLCQSSDSESAIQMRDGIVQGVLQPMAVDVITPPAATRLGLNGYVLAVRAGGSNAVLRRYSSAFPGATELSGRDETDFWTRVRDFPAEFMKRQPNGMVLRVSTTLAETRALLKMTSGSCISRAASGVTYVYLLNWESVLPLWSAAQEHGWSAVVESAPEDIRRSKELWLLRSDDASRNAFGMMEKLKRMFDPGQLLNRSRLYGRI